MPLPACLLPLLLAGPASAEPRAPGGLGVGIVLGDPTGISLAWRPEDDRFFVQAAAAWSLLDDRLHLAVDQLWQPAILETEELPAFRWPVYVGVGARVRVGAHVEDRIGLRLPLGVAMLPEAVPIDAFLEFVPVLDLLPETRPGLEGGIGVRYWF